MPEVAEQEQRPARCAYKACTEESPIEPLVEVPTRLGWLKQGRGEEALFFCCTFHQTRANQDPSRRRAPGA